MQAGLLQCWEETITSYWSHAESENTSPLPFLTVLFKWAIVVYQTAHERQKEILVSFIIHTERSLPQIKRQYISLALTYVNVTILKVHFLQELLL